MAYPYLKRLPTPVHRHQVRYQLARHGQGGPIAIPPFQFLLTHRCELRVITRRQFAHLDQDGLQMGLRCLEIGPRCSWPAELFCALVNPQ